MKYYRKKDSNTKSDPEFNKKIIIEEEEQQQQELKNQKSQTKEEKYPNIKNKMGNVARKEQRSQD